MPRLRKTVSALSLTAMLAAGCAPGSKSGAAAVGPGGALEFRILATPSHDGAAVAQALKPEGLEHPPDGYRWARLGEVVAGTSPKFTADSVTDPTQGWVKNRYSGFAVTLTGASARETVTVPVRSNTGNTLALARPHGLATVTEYRLEYNPGDVSADESTVVLDHPTANGLVERFLLVKLDPQNITNSDIARAYVTPDDRNKPAIGLTLNADGARKLGTLSREHLPENGGVFRYRLAILMDNQLVSAPTLNSEVRESAIIEGGARGFTAGEAESLVRMLLANLIVLGDGPDPAPAPGDAARLAFRDARFGLSVHWGVSSLLGKGESVMERDRLPVSEYEKLPPRFNPTEFDAEAWVKAARSAGARFLEVTAKHHDGFCMFDTRLTRYDVVDATPYARDPLKALAAACRKHKLPLFVSYSLTDWHHPDYVVRGKTGNPSGRDAKGEWARYVAYYQDQVRELCTNYGPIGGVRLVGGSDRSDADWDLAGTRALVHRLQPGALVANDRRDAPAGAVADVDVEVFDRDPPGVRGDGPPRAVFKTLNRSWGYDASDRAFAGEEAVVRLLVQAAGRDANLLLGVGAKPDGTIPGAALDRLADVGRWLETHGLALYGTRQGPIPPQPWGVSTEKVVEGRPTTIYLHVLNPGEKIRLPEVALSLDAHVLGKTKPMVLVQEGKQVVLTVPEADRSAVDTVIVLTPKVLDPEGAARR